MADKTPGDEKAEAAARIRYWRLKRELTQTQLAVMCEWPQSKVSRIETGELGVSALDVETIAEKFGLTMSEFYSARIKPEALAS